ncbi:MAG: hypothetical protein Q7S04_02025 [Candidatus Moranbacteria bacterium]|nr:hypothetical protein [Candidatus Moranbacteria bacterium]
MVKEKAMTEQQERDLVLGLPPEQLMANLRLVQERLDGGDSVNPNCSDTRVEDTEVLKEQK